MFCPRCKAPDTKSIQTKDGDMQCNVCSAIYSPEYAKKPMTRTPLEEPGRVSPATTEPLRELTEGELTGCYRGG